MRRLILVISILLFHWINSFEQKNDMIEKLTISYWGDSIIHPKYELIVKSKKVFLINPVVNYLDIKGGKHEYLIHLNKKDRQNIFNSLLKIDFSSLKYNEKRIYLDLSNLIQLLNFEGTGMYYTLEISDYNEDINSYTFPSEYFPTDIKELYNKIIKLQ
jgi:hypothetical protein